MQKRENEIEDIGTIVVTENSKSNISEKYDRPGTN